MTEPESLEILRERVDGLLGASFDAVSTDQDGDFQVRFDDVSVWVRLRPPDHLDQEDQTIVLIWSVAVIGMEVTPELTSYLATEGENLDFGQFELHEDVVPRIQVSHALLAEFMSREELTVAVEAVAGASRHHGAWIRVFHGGTAPWQFADLSTETRDDHEENHEEEPDGEETDEEWDAHERFVGARAAEERFRKRTRTKRRQRLQGAIGWMGLVAGVVAGRYAFTRTSSWVLALFVVTGVFWTFGFGLSRVVAKPRLRVQRLSFYAIGPFVATAVLFVTYRLWSRWWLSVILGVAGALVGAAAGARLFASVAREELGDGS